MINLITGQPGDGKTLYTITLVKALSEKDNRQVYYSGIPDLRLPWIELTEPEKWHDVPPGSIVVIDEAQRIFRPRGNGAAVPRHVAELETHRHKGLDLFIITQQPMLVDSNVRRLVGRHFHAKRKFGAPASTVHEWSQVKERPDQSRTESIRHEFIFPKSTYALYKSAEVHTHKLRIPMRMWAMCALPIIFAGLVYGTVQWFKGRLDPVKPVAAEVAPGGNATRGEISQGKTRQAKRDEPMTTEEYLLDLEPRVEGMYQTAPRYDRLTQAKSVPYPAACIRSGMRCQCYTQQATPLGVPHRICAQIVRSGMYLDFLEPPKPPVAAAGQSFDLAPPLPPAKQAGHSSPEEGSTQAPHTRPAEERSGDGWEGWRVDVRQAKPFVGPFEGVSRR